VPPPPSVSKKPPKGGFLLSNFIGVITCHLFFLYLTGEDKLGQNLQKDWAVISTRLLLNTNSTLKF
jgi:hypothetical protein